MRHGLNQAQQYLWSEAKLNPHIANYTSNYLFKLTGPVDMAGLSKAWDSVVKKHEVLRIQLAEQAGEPYRYSVPQISNSLAIIDNPLERVDALINKLANMPFQLEQAPLQRAYLIKQQDESHYFLWSFHPIILDSHASTIILQDVAKFYNAIISQQPINMIEQPAGLDPCLVVEEQSQESHNYWQSLLQGAPAMLNLPTDKARPQMKSYQGAAHSFSLDKTSLAALKTLSQSQQTSLFMSLLAALKILLARYSGQEDIVVGSFFAAGEERSSGFFTNALALRSKLTAEQSFVELLQQLKQTALEAYEHRAVAFEPLLDKLKVARDLSRSPLFQVMLLLQNNDQAKLSLHGLQVAPIALNQQSTKFDLTLKAQELSSGELSLRFEYATDLFELTTIQQMAAHLLILLQGIIKQPKQAISHLPLLTKAERKTLLIDWNQTEADYPSKTIHQLFEAQVEKTPDNIALGFETMRLTYRELNEKANQLAHYLRWLGVKSDTLVAISLGRSPELIIGILAILKAGGAYVPLDPAYPTDRLQFMLEDSKASILLVHSTIQQQFGEYRHTLLALDKWSYDAQSTLNPIAINAGHDLVYVIYTSGSTGKPKGVMVEHLGLTARLTALKARYPVTEQDKVIFSGSPSFDATIEEYLLPLISGAQVIVLPGLYLDMQQLAALTIRESITGFNGTPLLLQALLAEIKQQALTCDLAWRYVAVGGDELSLDLVKKFYQLSQAKLYNLYGPTEAVIDASLLECSPCLQRMSIGRPLANTLLYILDANQQPVPVGVAGELYIGGKGVARGYLNRPELNAEKFILNPFGEGRLYRTGDLVRYLSDSKIEFLGRMDNQVKIRGFRIELKEIETAVRVQPGIADVAVVVREDHGNKRLVAYLVNQAGLPSDEVAAQAVASIRQAIAKQLPDYMMPTSFMYVEKLPLTINGKLDEKALPKPDKIYRTTALLPPKNVLESQLLAIWQNLLEHEAISISDNFFEVGGNSLLLMQYYECLPSELKAQLTPTDLFKYPTIHSLSEYNLSRSAPQTLAIATAPVGQDAIAIIGLAGRFPGADNIEQFWHNLCQGVESIHFYSDEALLEAGVSPALLANPQYVKAKGVLSDVKGFDAAFFGISPLEAAQLDPQQRLFLETAYEALEAAGYNPFVYPKRIGVYGGSSVNTYLLSQLIQDSDQTRDWYQLALYHEKDFLCTRVAYKLNLTGPAVTVQTACSTSLAAIHMASMALRNGECEMALAGGISLDEVIPSGYLYQEGMVASPDGHCRVFDSQSQGTVFGQGVGIVVLKPLQQALVDGDTVYAVLKGSAINNDGALKMGFTAPSALKQAEVIAQAQVQAGVTADSISYIEAHGTGTILGDPIEIEGLTLAFNLREAAKRGYCALGSVKPNIGHLDAAAGVTGFIKTVLCLKHQWLVPTLHFQQPNPAIDFEQSPFYVNTASLPWRASHYPRRAGVSAFGFGGSNVHAVLEEAPVVDRKLLTRSYQILSLSAKTPTALTAAKVRLQQYLARHPELYLADVAYSLHQRQAFAYRYSVVCSNLTEAVQQLQGEAVSLVASSPLIFLFPGQGSQYAGMAKALYTHEPYFRAGVDSCLVVAKQQYPAWYEAIAQVDWLADTAKLHETAYTQPVLFIVEYALAQLLLHWGIKPQAMLGHSLGEYVAACLAGVFLPEEVLGLLIQRGELIQALPKSQMLSLALSATEAQYYLLAEPSLEIAVINSPRRCVVAGPAASITGLQQRLAASGVTCRLLTTSHAFHSACVEPVLQAYGALVSKVQRKPPQLPFISNVTGTWITAEQAQDASYWVAHLRQTVQFSQGVQTLNQTPSLAQAIWLEIGPGRALGDLVKQQLNKPLVVASLENKRDEKQQLAQLVSTLWQAGVALDFTVYYQGSGAKRILLPTYPFERKPYWLLDKQVPQATPSTEQASTPKAPVSLTEIERQLFAIWLQYLPQPVRSNEDNFFDLGGDSLTAINVLAQIERQFKIKLSPNQILQQPTIKALAILLTSLLTRAPLVTQAAKPSSLTLIQVGSAIKPPLFVVHAIGGTIYSYWELAQQLGESQPVYGFQARGLTGSTLPIDDIKEMASCYVAELLASQPRPSYCLGGSSFGGIVAYEMAQQLTARGYGIDVLAIIDSPGPGRMPEPFNDRAAILSYAYGKDLAFTVDDLKDLSPDRQIDFLYAKAKVLNFTSLPDRELMPALYAIWQAHERAMFSYMPKVYAGKVLYLAHTETMPGFPAKAYQAWIDLAENFELVRILGNHLSMNQGKGAEKIAHYLQKAMEKVAPT
jgi:amino acid adenylation domain-containing protein